MSEFEIEKNVVYEKPFKSKYKFKEMNVGDSFFFTSEQKSAVRGAAVVYSKANNVKFMTRAVDGGYRIWRIS